VSATDLSPEPRAWPDYRAIWRWHFYAGLFCIPFVLVLACSGSIYLFKPQIEAQIDAPYDHLAVSGARASAAEQIRAALAAFPDSALEGYELPATESAAARIIVDRAGRPTRVYVHPHTLQVLKTVDEDARFMRVLFRLHGELLMGNRGSAIVELAASWAIIMIVTGLCLWWPRQASGLGGILYPRLFRGSRIFWRDLHGVTGFWISGLALFLLLSGLPWAKFWGDCFRNVRRITGTSVARQDWTNGTSTKSHRHGGGAGEHGGGARRRGGRARASGPVDLTAVDRIVATVQPLGLAPPVVIAPPGGDSHDWTAKSLAANRPLRVDLVVDPATGAVKERREFKDRHIIDRIVGTGVAAHEGQLFGWPNQLLGLITAAGLVLLSLSAMVLWWRRREPGTLGAPRPRTAPRFSLGLLLLVVLFGLYLPLFGASLVVVLALEKLVLSRVPATRAWLGLHARASAGRPA
jgi:uncharacterized iron-regulated membrane protein